MKKCGKKQCEMFFLLLLLLFFFFFSFKKCKCKMPIFFSIAFFTHFFFQPLCSQIFLFFSENLKKKYFQVSKWVKTFFKK